jgi:proton-dependent oligopeptide transporter, POT family
MGNLDPIAIALLIPILDRIIYPLLRRRGIQLKPITRISLGFAIGAMSMVYAAWLQSVVYAAPPCFDNPLKCAAAELPDGTILHNKVHIAWQSPAFILIALSEILCSVTGLEYAYTNAPRSMKSFIMSLFLLTSAGGAALGVVIAPFARDPNMVWFYAGLSLSAAIFGLAFWFKFRSLNKMERGNTVRADVIADESDVIGAVGVPAIPLTSRTERRKRKPPRE